MMADNQTRSKVWLRRAFEVLLVVALIAGTLQRHGIIARIRDSAGQEIEGACGQLCARVVKA